MKKLSLHVEELQVESFLPVEEQQSAKGTVNGHATGAVLGCPNTEPTGCEPGCLTYGYPGGGDFCGPDTIEGECYTMNLRCP